MQKREVCRAKVEYKCAQEAKQSEKKLNSCKDAKCVTYIDLRA